MSARVSRDATALVAAAEEAGTVYGRGFFGLPGPQGLQLDRYETVYLAEMGRLEVRTEADRPLPWPELFRRALRAEPGFDVRYVVYRDLRQRGYVVRAGAPAVAFAVLPRGGVLNKSPARFWVDAVSERAPFDLERLRGLADRAQSARKTLLVGVVDEESDLTYYRVRRPAPKGSQAVAPGTAPVAGWLSDDRVVLFDAGAVEALGGSSGFGSRIGSRLELSLLEAAYLVARGELALREGRSGRAVDAERLVRQARRLDHQFSERLAAYTALRDRGLVVKTGFKYGSHFRAYLHRPEHTHARFLVDAVPQGHLAPWPEVAGAVRVAQGVRKELLFASVDPQGPVAFVGLERVRP